MRLLGQSHSVGQIAERTGKSYYTIERRVSFLTELTGLDRRRIAIKFGDGKKHVNTPVELKSDEKQVLKAIINEKVKNAEISKETKFSTNKVDKILKRIREKTGIENNNQVAVNAIELLLEDSQKQ
ncbi:MAG: helix-turn-helix transcriptional regulator, partial [Candidatus Micrarchaeia archaeon]